MASRQEGHPKEEDLDHHLEEDYLKEEDKAHQELDQEVDQEVDQEEDHQEDHQEGHQGHLGVEVDHQDLLIRRDRPWSLERISQLCQMSHLSHGRSRWNSLLGAARS